MVKKYLSGIDIGTTGAKASIFDIDGNMIGSAYREYHCNYPHPNWIEQDPDFLISEVMDASREAIYKSGISPFDIASLSLSTQRSCAIFIDKSGSLLRPMISWQDSRCSQEVIEISEKISQEEYYRITGFPNNSTWLLPEILWIRKNEPDVWEKTFKILQLQDYSLIAFGIKEYITDVSDAGFSGMWDTNKLNWNNKILKIFDIDPKLLPTVVESG